MITNLATNCSQAAIALATQGLSIFPCQPRGKTPATARGLLDATTEAERIAGWWGRIPDLNLAIATGRISGCWVLDVDGDDGESSLRKLESEHSALPPTIEVITGKGRHLYFRIGEHGTVKNSAGQVAPGIDVRGDGGYAPGDVNALARAIDLTCVDTQAIAAIAQRLQARVRASFSVDAMTDAVLAAYAEVLEDKRG